MMPFPTGPSRRLTAEEFAAFAEACLIPPKPSARLVELMRRKPKTAGVEVMEISK